MKPCIREDSLCFFPILPKFLAAKHALKGFFSGVNHPMSSKGRFLGECFAAVVAAEGRGRQDPSMDWLGLKNKKIISIQNIWLAFAKKFKVKNLA